MFTGITNLISNAIIFSKLFCNDVQSNLNSPVEFLLGIQNANTTVSCILLRYYSGGNLKIATDLTRNNSAVVVFVVLFFMLAFLVLVVCRYIFEARVTLTHLGSNALSFHSSLSNELSL